MWIVMLCHWVSSVAVQSGLLDPEHWQLLLHSTLSASQQTESKAALV